MERELEKTSVAYGARKVMLYRFVDTQRAEGFGVRLICSVVERLHLRITRGSDLKGWSGAAGRGCTGGRPSPLGESAGTYGSPRVR